MKFWHYVSRLCLVAAAGAFLQIQPALSQDQGAGQYAGQWSCRFSMEPFNKNPIDTHYWEFGLVLQPNGHYAMQGFYYSPSLGVQIPVQGEGAWALTNQGPRGIAISVNGQLFRQDSGWQPFQFVVTPADNRNLYMQFKGNTHMTNISCQR